MEVTEEIDDIFGIQINQQNDPLYYNIYDVPLEYHQIREEQLRKEEEMKNEIETRKKYEEEIIEQNKKEIEQQKIALEEKKNEKLKRNKQLQFEGIKIIVKLR